LLKQTRIDVYSKDIFPIGGFIIIFDEFWKAKATSDEFKPYIMKHYIQLQSIANTVKLLASKDLYKAIKNSQQWNSIF
jgi:hypothetical protein